MKGNRRWVIHKSYFYKEKKYKSCNSYIVFENAELDGVLPTYIVLENYAEISDDDLAKREQSYLDNFDCVNKKRAFVSIEEKTDYSNISKEWRKKNKEYASEYNKKYNETHKEEIYEMRKKYYETHKEKIQEQRRKRYAEKKIKANTIDAQTTDQA